ncbi:hypothetical protein ACJVC5_03465 [Peredibacter sp. HCB2-198]|uniref:hypothetical protein n=1 Tax=Peredibacter sp. HCB2-198 TaxID=3383025 RepID=UPI0038B4DD64
MNRFLALLFILNSVAFAQDWVEQEGVRFHSSCKENFGDEFQNNFHAGIKMGLACLDKLNTPMTKIHITSITKLLASKKLVVGCHYTDYFKKSTAAATSSGSEAQNAPAYGLIHPFIAFNSKEARSDWYDVPFMKAVSFHELFHNIGYVHGMTEEYAYACEECCFGENPDVKATACKVCSSKYEGLKDPAYFDDFTKYTEASPWKKSFRFKVAIRFGLLANPNSFTLLELLLSNDGKGNALSIASARSWKDKFASEYIVSTAGQPYSEIEERIEGLIVGAYKARQELMIENNVSASIQSFLALNVEDLRNYFAADPEYAEIFWDAVLYDMDVLFDLKRAGHKLDLAELDKKYLEILAAKPREITNQ